MMLRFAFLLIDFGAILTPLGGVHDHLKILQNGQATLQYPQNGLQKVDSKEMRKKKLDLERGKRRHGLRHGKI